jgi:sucrose-6-phosphate hydrolase SacC (GH32 family)
VWHSCSLLSQRANRTHSAALWCQDDAVGQWECPDLFPVRGGGGAPNATHVLKVSVDNVQADYWVVGEMLLVWLFQPAIVSGVCAAGIASGAYDDVSNTFTRSRDDGDMGVSPQKYDYGRFYASKTMYYPPTDEQVLFGWLPEERDVDAHGAPYGWAGVMSLPRSVTVDPTSARVVTAVLDTVESLRVQSSAALFGEVRCRSCCCCRNCDTVKLVLVGVLCVHRRCGVCGVRLMYRPVRACRCSLVPLRTASTACRWRCRSL